MCPHCSKWYNMDEKYTGKRIACKGCGEKFVIEDLDGPDRSAGGVPI